MQWQEVLEDPEFQAAPPEQKKLAADNFFKQYVESDPEYQSAPEELRLKARGNLYSSFGMGAPVETRPPTDVGAPVPNLPTTDVTENPDPFGGTAAPQDFTSTVAATAKPEAWLHRGSHEAAKGIVHMGELLVKGLRSHKGYMSDAEFERAPITKALDSAAEYLRNTQGKIDIETAQQGLLAPELQATSTPGKIAQGLIEFLPSAVTTVPLSGAGKVLSLTEKGAATIAGRFGYQGLEIAKRILVKAGVRATGGAAAGTLHAAATGGDIPSEAAGFAVATPIAGAFIDFLRIAPEMRKWWEAATNDEKALALVPYEQLKAAGKSDAEIAKMGSVYFEEQMKRRGAGSVPRPKEPYEDLGVPPNHKPTPKAEEVGKRVDQMDKDRAGLQDENVAMRTALEEKFGEQFRTEETRLYNAYAQASKGMTTEQARKLPEFKAWNDYPIDIVDWYNQTRTAPKSAPGPAQQGGPAPTPPPEGAEPPPSPVEEPKKAPAQPERKRSELPQPEEITHNPYAGENKWPNGTHREVAPFDETDRSFLKNISSYMAGMEAPGKLYENQTVSRSSLPKHMRNLGITKDYVGIVDKMIAGEPVTWNQYQKVKGWLDEEKVFHGWRPGEGWPKPEPVEEEVPFDKGGYTKKPKPEQQGMDLGIKGEGLRKPEQKGGGVDMNDTPLGKATNEAADRKKQSKMDFGEGGGQADVGGYADTGTPGKSSIEQPEIVKLGKQLLGEYPGVKKALRKFAGRAIGVYFPNKGTWGKIDVRADAFATPGLAERVIAHEIGHADDFLPDKTLKRGNLGGSIAKLRNFREQFIPEKPGAPGPLTQAERDALRKEARKIAKEEADKVEAGKKAMDETGLTADDIKAVWNDVQARDKYKDLYDFIARMSGPEKASILKAVMKGEVPQSIKDKFSKAKKEGRDPYADLDAREKEVFDDLIAKEAKKRKLFNLETINAELKRLTQLWKPFDETIDPALTKYRYKPRELYADALSVLINDPALLQREAPEFYRAFFNYQEVRPEFRDAYNEIQNLIGRGEKAVGESRSEDVHKMFEREEESTRALERARRSPKEVMRRIIEALALKNEEVYYRVNKAVKEGVYIEDAENPRFWAEELPYIESEIFAWFDEMEVGIFDKLKEAETDPKFLDEYMLYNRVATEYKGKAAPLGLNEKTAKDQIQFMREKHGNEKMDKIVDAQKEFARLWQDYVIRAVKESNIGSQALLDFAEGNMDYATFKASMEKQFGGQEFSGQLFPRKVGTLGEVKSVLTASILKGEIIIRAARIKQAIKSMTDFMLKSYPDEIWKEGEKPPENVKVQDYKTLSYPEKGETVTYHVPKALAETYERSPYKANIITRAWQLLHVPFRTLVVTHNPRWMVGNAPKDLMRSIKNTPEATPLEFARYVAKANQLAWQEIFGETSFKTPKLAWESIKRMWTGERQGGEEGRAFVRNMMRQKSIPVDRAYTARDIEDTDELDRMRQRFDFGNSMSPVQYRNFIVRPLVKVWEQIVRAWELSGKFGKHTERQGKITGQLVLEERQRQGREIAGRPLTEKGIAHRVRTRITTPNVKEGGTAKAWTNNVFTFSSIAIEDFRSSWESYKEDKAGYAWKTIGYSVLPKLAMKLVKYGVLGVAAKEIMDKVSEYRKTVDTVVPLGLTESGKAVVFTFPNDYTGQAIGGLVWKLAEGKIGGPKGVLSYTSDQQPYNLSPVFKLGLDWFSYQQTGNAWDSHYGKPVLSDTVAKAGGTRALGGMIKHTWNEIGGTTFYRFGTDDADKIREWYEKALQTYGGRAIGRFIAIMDTGEKEQLREATDSIEQKRARRSLGLKDAIVNSINAAGGKPSYNNMFDAWKKAKNEKLIVIGEPGFLFSNFEARYKRMSQKTKDSPKIDAVIYATTNEEKGALLMYYEDHMEKPEFQKLFNQLIAEGYLKEGSLTEWIKMKPNGGQ